MTFFFTIAKLREEIETWRKENIKTHNEYLSKIDELEGSKLRIAVLESEKEKKQERTEIDTQREERIGGEFGWSFRMQETKEMNKLK